MGKKNYVCVPKGEYDALIECKLHINELYEFITKEHAQSIKVTGRKRGAIDMETIELVCGYSYSDNENYFNKLEREFKERMRKKCE